MKTFVRSPLATASSPTAAEIDSIDAIYGHADVQRAAGHLQLRRARLLELAGFRSAVAEAVLASGDPASVTAAQVAATLNRLADEVDDEIAAACEDKAQHDARHKARLARLMPLRREVSQRLTTLTAEREVCVRRIDACRRASSLSGVGINRHANLVAVGLSSEQIASLGTGYASQEDQETALRDRIAVLDAELAPLREFGASGDVARLAGLGFDALIHARNAAEQVPA